MLIVSAKEVLLYIIIVAIFYFVWTVGDANSATLLDSILCQ